MDQIHKRFTVEQIRALLRAYGQGTMGRVEVEEVLGIGKTRFFTKLTAMCHSTAKFSGPLSFRMRLWSSRKATSKTQCRLFSIAQ